MPSAKPPCTPPDLALPIAWSTPYLAWVSFAAYLNATTWWLNGLG